MNADNTGDLELGFQGGVKGYSVVRTEDIFDPDSKWTSGISIKFGPDLATRELDLQSIIQVEPKVYVRYTWNYSDYIVVEEDGEEWDNNLPYEWLPTIDQDDDSTWPRDGRKEWYVDGELVKVRVWEFGNEDWDK